MDNKLSELSKPVAWTDERGNLCTNRNKERGLESRYHQDYEKYTTPFYSQEYVSALLAELEAKDKRIAELEAIRGAAEKLVRCKGRYHSEQNYRALAALFGVTTPDLPPVDGDSEEVIAELRAKLATPVRLPKYEDYNDAGAASAAISDCEIAIRAAGFKVEGDE
ncbi:hypothetical protein [Serratia marcescens]|uniref:hypothetical protein n=1 Tax=Serratia marcescens TaxID=615 RepID=UPI003D160B0E